MSNRPVLAIDFGTSNCAAAWLDDDGRVHVAAIKDDVALLPTVAWYGPHGHILVGQPAKQQAVEDPRNTIFGIKRFMGYAWSSPFVHRHKDRFAFELAEAADGSCGVRIGDTVKPLEDVAVDILLRLCELAAVSAGTFFQECMITVPAHFGYGQRQAIRRSVERAGLAVKGMVNEPTAAAMYYARKKGNDGTILVFDLGGGTFDVTLMTIVSGVVKVLASGGDAFLGGADFDHKIVEHMIASFHDQRGIDLRSDTSAMQRLLIAAEAAKIELTKVEDTRIRVPCVAMRGETFLDLELRLTRKQLDDMTAPLVEKCLGACSDVLKKAGLQPMQVDEIVFVGGMTRMPAIRKRVAEIFNANPTKAVHPDLGVVVGAALLTGGDASLIDVTSMAIGASLPGGKDKELVPANTSVPKVLRVMLDRPPAGQPFVAGIYEAVDVQSLDRDLLGTVRAEVDWLNKYKGALSIEVWLNADLDIALFLQSSDGGKLQLPLLQIKRTQRSAPEVVSTSVKPGFRSVTLGTRELQSLPVQQAQAQAGAAGAARPAAVTMAGTPADGSSDSGSGSGGDDALDDGDEANAPKPGDSVGGYLLLDIIGKGGMGRVYLAEHKRLGRRVALKMLRKRYRKDSTALDRFLAEARAVNQIRHENIIEVTDLFESDDGRACYIMEVLEGRSLAELLKSVGTPRLERSVRIAFQVASAMVAVHDAHIIHRDLKPENIFLTQRGAREDFVKLLDFGVAKLVDEEGQSLHDTAHGARVGTLDYMPPEQALGQAVDHRVDIYALGIVLYEMITGKRPFEGGSDRALLFQQLEKPPTPPSQVMATKRAIPKELDELILECLARDAERRPQTMREVRGRLEAIAERLQAPATTVDAPAAPVIIQGPNMFASMPTTDSGNSQRNPAAVRPAAQPGARPAVGPAGVVMGTPLQPAAPATATTAPPPSLASAALQSTAPTAPLPAAPGMRMLAAEAALASTGDAAPTGDSTPPSAGVTAPSSTAANGQLAVSTVKSGGDWAGGAASETLIVRKRAPEVVEVRGVPALRAALLVLLAAAVGVGVGYVVFGPGLPF